MHKDYFCTTVFREQNQENINPMLLITRLILLRKLFFRGLEWHGEDRFIFVK